MKQRKTALLLAAALTLSLVGAAALAAEDPAPLAASRTVPAAEEIQPEARETAVLADAQPEAPESSETPEEPQIPDEDYIPDPVGTVTFANLSRRMHENNLQILAIQESITNLELLDYDYILDDMRETIANLSRAQWMMVMMGQQGTLAYEQLDQANQAVWDQFESIKDGDMQKDNADMIRQLKNLQDQTVMAGEATYIALAAMEIQEGGLERQLSALDRQLEELELRHQLGHISSMTLREAQGGRTALTSGLSTLRMNLDTYKGQLELLMGADITGQIKLGALPAVTQKDLNTMDLEKDLETAKENSWQLYSAQLDLKDAKQDFADRGGELASDYRPKDPQYMQVRYGYYAARHTYNNTVQNFELGLRNLYLKVQDCKQILDASKTALAVAQDSRSAAQLKYSQGSLSKNALLEAEDKVSEAQEKVDSASNDLFSAYNTYRWAVDYGILN